MPDEEDGEVFYETLLERMDAGELPVACFISPGVVYYRSFKLQPWATVLTGTQLQRQGDIVRVVRFAFREGVRGRAG